MKETFSVVFHGFTSKKQAKAFADWYEGQGEQDACDWLEEHVGVISANVDLKKPIYPYKIIDNVVQVHLNIVEKEEDDE